LKRFVKHRSLSKSELGEAARSWLHALDEQYGVIMPAQVAPTIIFEGLQAKYQEAMDFDNWAESLCMQMRRCLTRNGYLGQVPRSAAIGDMICVIAGAAVPFTIRPNRNGYTLIGQTYLHGLMTGEAMNMPELIKEDILLV